MKESFKKIYAFGIVLLVFALAGLSIFMTAQKSEDRIKNVEAVKIEDAQDNIERMLDENLALSKRLIEYENKTTDFESVIKQMNNINYSVQNLLFSYESFQNEDFQNSAEYIKDVDIEVLTDRQKNIYNTLVSKLANLGYNT